MASYSIQASDVSQTTPKLSRGQVSITSSVPIYWVVGENPIADSRCSIILAHDTRIIRLPVSCSKLAVLAVETPGTVSIVEINGIRSSCMA